VSLRVKDFNFDARTLTVRGKGNKSRTVPLPEQLVPELEKQMETVGELYEKDRAANFAGVFLEDQLEKKYPNAAREIIWQWFFPQESLTRVEETKEQRRYHIHDTHVQEALYEGQKGSHQEARHLPLLPPFLRDAPAPGQLRYPHDSDAPRACRCAHDDDLHPLRSEPDDKGSQKPAGFLNPAPDMR
jgi:hypothetical protein